jgi:hypothetical protein
VDGTDTSLADLSEQTGWYCWQGVVPAVYARLPKSSPPIVLRAPDVPALREAINRAEKAMAWPPIRRAGHPAR